MSNPLQPQPGAHGQPYTSTPGQVPSVFGAQQPPPQQFGGYAAFPSGPCSRGFAPQFYGAPAPAGESAPGAASTPGGFAAQAFYGAPQAYGAPGSFPYAPAFYPGAYGGFPVPGGFGGAQYFALPPHAVPVSPYGFAASPQAPPQAPPPQAPPPPADANVCVDAELLAFLEGNGISEVVQKAILADVDDLKDLLDATRDEVSELQGTIKKLPWQRFLTALNDEKTRRAAARAAARCMLREAASKAHASSSCEVLSRTASAVGHCGSSNPSSFGGARLHPAMARRAGLCLCSSLALAAALAPARAPRRRVLHAAVDATSREEQIIALFRGPAERPSRRSRQRRRASSSRRCSSAPAPRGRSGPPRPALM
mmetsp:Transcript_8754/g.26490  ORF Transcript_8754/g.26490 Transcript_8754/m.26490 type:complete len:368 (+) Transcript_8754:115-1218(+)